MFLIPAVLRAKVNETRSGIRRPSPIHSFGEGDSSTKQRLSDSFLAGSLWERRFRELCEFVQHHGHCCPQNVYLRKWLYKQRGRHRRGLLASHRERKLVLVHACALTPALRPKRPAAQHPGRPAPSVAAPSVAMGSARVGSRGRVSKAFASIKTESPRVRCRAVEGNVVADRLHGSPGKRGKKPPRQRPGRREEEEALSAAPPG